MQDLHADREHNVEITGLAVRPGPVTVRLRLHLNSDGEAVVDEAWVNDMAVTAPADVPLHLVVVNLPESEDRLIGMPGIVALTSLSESSIKAYIKAGDFVQGFRIKGNTRKLYWLSQVKAWMHARLVPDEDHSKTHKRRPRKAG